ncbi:unnamed protein product, partial [marine sediment metagenome]
QSSNDPPDAESVRTGSRQKRVLPLDLGGQAVGVDR